MSLSIIYYNSRDFEETISGNGHATKVVAIILSLRCVFKIRSTLVEMMSIILNSQQLNSLMKKVPMVEKPESRSNLYKEPEYGDCDGDGEEPEDEQQDDEAGVVALAAVAFHALERKRQRAGILPVAVGCHRRHRFPDHRGLQPARTERDSRDA